MKKTNAERLVDTEDADEEILLHIGPICICRTESIRSLTRANFRLQDERDALKAKVEQLKTEDKSSPPFNERLLACDYIEHVLHLVQSDVREIGEAALRTARDYAKGRNSTVTLDWEHAIVSDEIRPGGVGALPSHVAFRNALLEVTVDDFSLATVSGHAVSVVMLSAVGASSVAEVLCQNERDWQAERRGKYERGEVA